MTVNEFMAMLKQFDGDRIVGFATNPESDFEVASVYPNDDGDKKVLWIDLMPRKVPLK